MVSSAPYIAEIATNMAMASHVAPKGEVHSLDVYEHAAHHDGGTEGEA
jgi:hypothetical protein